MTTVLVVFLYFTIVSLFVSFESDFQAYLLDLWLKFLEKSSWKAVLFTLLLVPWRIPIVIQNKTSTNHFIFELCGYNLKTSFAMHNHAIFLFSLVKAEHSQNICTVWLCLNSGCNNRGRMEKGLRKLKLLPPQKMNCFEATTEFSQNM